MKLTDDSIDLITILGLSFPFHILKAAEITLFCN